MFQRKPQRSLPAWYHVRENSVLVSVVAPENGSLQVEITHMCIHWSSLPTKTASAKVLTRFTCYSNEMSLNMVSFLRWPLTYYEKEPEQFPVQCDESGVSEHVLSVKLITTSAASHWSCGSQINYAWHPARPLLMSTAHAAMRGMRCLTSQHDYKVVFTGEARAGGVLHILCVFVSSGPH